MRVFIPLLLGFILVACAPRSQEGQGSFEAVRSSIDQQNDPSIEDYILALPPYAFHEESLSSFARTVRSARALPQNYGKSRDYLFCPSDGKWPPREFTLERASQRLIIHVHKGAEADGPPYTTTMRRVRGGWIREG